MLARQALVRYADVLVSTLSTPQDCGVITGHTTTDAMEVEPVHFLALNIQSRINQF
jgi:hypothetical protein